MAYVIRKVIEQYFYWNDECGDPRVKDWFLFKDPLPIVCIICGYLYFVLKLGPQMMKNREPFRLNWILRVYNLVQVITSAIIVIEPIRNGYFKNYNFICEGIDMTLNEVSMGMVFYGYVYFLLKIVDLLDTVFFVLRKKQNQVTFLHVYHHTGMILLVWTGMKYFPGGQSASLPLLNSLVHTIMYFYYFLTTIDKSYTKSIWWKKHITQLQIIQFGLLAIHWSLLILKPWLVPACTYPMWTLMILLPQNLFMCTLFVDFYIKTYVNPKTKSE